MNASTTGNGSLIRAGIILLTIATAVTHLQLGFPDPIFILNGLGYLGLLGALYLPIPLFAPYRGMIRWVLIGYTALTILLWVAFGFRTTIGYINKANELLLIVLLLIEARRERSHA